MSCWFVLILGASVAGGSVWAIGAFRYSRGRAYPWEVQAAGFTGTVKEFSKIAVTSGSAGLIAAVLSEELDPYPFFQHAMLAVLIVSVFNAIASYFLTASLDPATTEDGKKIKLENRAWEVMHGFIFGSTFVSMIAAFVALINVAIAIQRTS